MISWEEAMMIACNKVQMGEMSTDQANVYAVQLVGARLIKATLRKEVRAALNAAVKAGELGHIKKDGLKAEAYHHNNGRTRALDLIEADFRDNMSKLKGVFA